MTISMYQASVPTIVRALNNLIAVLEKADQHAAAKEIEPAAFGSARLDPDSFAPAEQGTTTPATSTSDPAHRAQRAPPPRKLLCGSAPHVASGAPTPAVPQPGSANARPNASYGNTRARLMQIASIPHAFTRHIGAVLIVCARTIWRVHRR